LVTFVKEYKNYDILLFIHSKHSLFNSELAGWRKVIFSQLLGSTLLIKDILALFNTFPQLGMVSPNHFEPILFAVKWGPNWEGSNQLAKRMEIHLDQNAPLDFPSGSMFWARPKALLPLINLKLSFDEFEPENGQTDGALGHQIERLFYFCCEKAGYSWLKISLPELFKDRKKIVIVRDVKDIESLLEQKLGT
jgi:O-antigen biosynthesis protein